MNGDREEARAKMIESELDWVERRWGHEFAACIAWSVYGEGMPIGTAEYFHGVGYGLITPDGHGWPHTPLDSEQTVAPWGAHNLEEVESLEERAIERVESMAMASLGHGF